MHREILKQEYEAIRPGVISATGIPVPLWTDIKVEYAAATSWLMQTRFNKTTRQVTALRVSTVHMPEHVDHSFRITLIHEMCHMSPVSKGHDQRWKRDFRRGLDWFGYTKHPAIRVYSEFSSELHPHLEPLNPGERAPRLVLPKRNGFVYYCNCPGRSLGEGGYGVRSRRSLHGRTCSKCGVLHCEDTR